MEVSNPRDDRAERNLGGASVDAILSPRQKVWQFLSGVQESTIPEALLFSLNLKSQASSHPLCLYTSVCGGPVKNPIVCFLKTRLINNLDFSTDRYRQSGSIPYSKALRRSSQRLHEQRLHIHRTTAGFPPGVLLLL